MTFRRCVGFLAVVGGLLGLRCAEAGVSYQDPAGGWQYSYQGTFNAPVVDAGCTGGTCPAGYGSSNQTGALDGTWIHNQSSKWDGSAPGVFSVPNNDPTGTSPGGAAALTEGGTNYVRLQDTGNPESFGYIQAAMRPTNSNRRVYFGHDMTQDVDLSAPGSQKVLDNGITVSFRMRIPSSGTLDSVYPTSGAPTQNWFVSPEGDYNDDGYVDAADYILWRKNLGTSFQLNNEVQGVTPGMVTPEDYTAWRARFGTGPIGRGYPIHDDGRGMITVLQNNNTADPFDPFNGVDGTVAFSMVTSKDIQQLCAVAPGSTICSGSGSGGLMMNNQSGNAPNNSVDSYDTGQMLNLVEIPDAGLSDWHEFWITIQDKTAAGNGALPGTHTVKVYMDGATTPTSFQVTMSGSGNGAYSKIDIAPFLEFGLSNTDQFGSFDMDFLSYHLGVVAPVAAGSGALAGAAVPEPSSLFLAIVAISSICYRRYLRDKS
jgi:hypothetical protein